MKRKNIGSTENEESNWQVIIEEKKQPHIKHNQSAWYIKSIRDDNPFYIHDTEDVLEQASINNTKEKISPNQMKKSYSHHWYHVLYTVAKMHDQMWMIPHWVFSLILIIVYALQYSALGYFVWVNNPDPDTTTEYNFGNYDIGNVLFVVYDILLALWMYTFFQSGGSMNYLRLSWVILILILGTMIAALYYIWVAGSVVGFSVYIPVAIFILISFYLNSVILKARYTVINLLSGNSKKSNIL